MMTNPQGILRSPVETFEGRAEFVRLLFAGDERAKTQSANDNEYDDEGGEERDDD